MELWGDNNNKNAKDINQGNMTFIPNWSIAFYENVDHKLYR